jgi:hypothetical protein
MAELNIKTFSDKPMSEGRSIDIDIRLSRLVTASRDKALKGCGKHPLRILILT